MCACHRCDHVHLAHYSNERHSSKIQFDNVPPRHPISASKSRFNSRYNPITARMLLLSSIFTTILTTTTAPTTTKQHAPVYTMGKRGTNQDFIQAHGVQEAIALGADIAAVPRGGETTFHGPGQLIAYPLINLRHLNMGARVYVETLEDIMIACARQYNITTAKVGWFFVFSFFLCIMYT